MSKDPSDRYYQKNKEWFKKKRPVKDVKLFLKNKKKKAIIWSKNDIQNLPEDRDKGWFELWKVILKYIKRLMPETSLKTSLKYYWSTIRSSNGRTPIDRAVNENNEEALLLLQN